MVETMVQEEGIDSAVAHYQTMIEDSSFDIEEHARQVYARELVQEATSQAQSGGLITATATLSQALELDPTLELTPTTHARQVYAHSLVRKSNALARQGNIITATTFLSHAQELDSAVKITANDWNALCWYGSLWGYAAEVMDACQQAVSLEPTHGGLHDSRGLARALTGDTEGAMEDFAAFVL
jgi:tetratricopeptide (TPR) repeat protein